MRHLLPNYFNTVSVMSKLAIILLFVSISFAKITKNQFKLITKNNEFSDEYKTKNYLKSNLTTWVLNLNDDSLDFRRLYLANKEEKKVFENVIAPAIKNYKLQHSTKADTVSNEWTEDERGRKNQKDYFGTDNVNEIKHHIMILINKFFLNLMKDPVTYFSDDVIAKEKSLKLYIVGPYTSLIMTSGKLRHHYFISSPSKFPRWFYRDHDNVVTTGESKYVIIPTVVQREFLIKLLDVLKLYTSYPV